MGEMHDEFNEEVFGEMLDCIESNAAEFHVVD
jgi:hypothetical protein